MTKRFLVTGGTGTVGSVVVEHLTTAGNDVRVLSRGRRRQHRPDVQHVVGDVRTGDGLDAAVDGVDTIVHCVYPAQHLVAAAKRAGSPHLVYVSIVGIDRIPFGFYRKILANERLIAGSGLPWTVLRATQFHDLVAVILRMLAKPPVMAVPSVSDQPVDVREVGERLARLALSEPVGRAPDFGGPQVRAFDDLARSYLSIVGRRRPIAPIRLPGKAFRGFRSGGHLAPDHAAGTITFERYLREQLEAGRLPYGDAIRDYLRPRKESP
ncbi:SDR family oxidoreductase [Mycobacterium sp. 852002-51057_SCH5723018]|uniref:SDR family oxidoreductase n=1 Tax=Mycobacterium sp. 852002-51057_SCH5723018 TaxID=1834094 RepID=UPI0008006384|nr:SDR family oxidoreductase [Mycobacterium sp. 852002-51057_SCH5723018]OBG19325.1 NmrA family transcriptional regulator [Mycobacterium sp. 852002-51057_SCH5723018]